MRSLVSFCTIAMVLLVPLMYRISARIIIHFGARLRFGMPHVHISGVPSFSDDRRLRMGWGGETLKMFVFRLKVRVTISN